jgi:ABC-type dipeptide/oligopeptide/nickel transport system permease component
MTKYILARTGQSLLMVLGVLFLVFGMLRLTGDPTDLLAPREATEEQRQEAREAYGLDRPVTVQFVDFATDAIRLDFGTSLRYKQPVSDIIKDRFPATVELAIAAMLFAFFIGVPLGVLAGVKAGTKWDSFSRGFGLLGQTIPSFWLSLVLIVVFAVNLGWFPSFGRSTMSIGFMEIPDKSIILPALALGLFPMAQLLRFTRSSVLEIVNEDYIRIARSKGLRAPLIYVRHILRNAMIPLISVLSLQVGALLGGSLYIEAVFSWPGAGGLLAEAVSNRDFQLVQGLAFFGALIVIVVSLIADILYTVADPRIRVGGMK